MPSGIAEIAGKLTLSGTCRPRTGGMDMTAQENGCVNQRLHCCARPEACGTHMIAQDIGANKIGRVILLENGCVGQRGQAAGVREIGRVFLQMLGMVLCPGKARPYFAN